MPLHQEYVEAVRGVARQDHAVLCDLAGDIAAINPRHRRALFLKDGIHLNHHGAERAANVLADCLDKAGVLDRVAAAP